MIVFRLTHTMKPGCRQAAVDLLKEYREYSPDQDRIRIYSSKFGPHHSLIWEQEFESMVAYEENLAELHNHPMADTFWERMDKLVDSGGSMEIWNLE